MHTNPICHWSNLPIRPPTGFGWTPSFQVFFDPQQLKFRSTLDVAAMAPSGTALYVDIATGNNGNTGLSWAQALKGIGAAIDKLKLDPTLHVVYVRSGDYTFTWRWDNDFCTQDVSFYAVDGPVITSSRADTQTWTKTVGRNFVYEAPITVIRSVVDRAQDSGEGNGTVLPVVADVAACDATPASYYTDGVKVYVHTYDDRAADGNIRVYRQGNGPQCTAAGNMYVENFIFEGCNASVFTVSAATRAVFVNCKFLYSGSGNNCNFNLTIPGGEIYLINCVSGEAAADGFGYADWTHIYEENCVCSGNGRGTGTTNNGSSAHVTGNLIRLNGTYKRNWGPNIADVDATQSWNLGCLLRDYRGGAPSGANVTSDSADIWLHRVTSILDAAPWDFYENGGGTIYKYACVDGGQYSGNVIDYVP